MEDIPSSAAERFSEGVGNLLVITEELRRSVSTAVQKQQQLDTAEQSDVSSASHHPLPSVVDLALQWQLDLEHLVQCLDVLARWTMDAVAAVEEDLYRHCRDKAIAVARQVLDTALTFHEPTTITDESVSLSEIRKEGQGAVARIVELNLLLHHSHLPSRNKNGIDPSGEYGQMLVPDEIIQGYTAYQRQVLRLRVRPVIAELVDLRKRGLIVTPTVNDITGNNLQTTITAGSQDDDDEEGRPPYLQQHHSPVLTVILSEAAALIHPLLAWKVNLPPVAVGEPIMVAHIRKLCQMAIEVLDEQAQSLVKTVAEWYCEDRPIDEWMKRSAELEAVNGDDDLNRHQRQLELAILDSLVEEMAFSCQVMARYQSLLLGAEGIQSQTVICHQILPEWTWKYAALERFLAMQQWKSALEFAAPVQIVLGTQVQVPSVVEDAQYLSTRALERAATTRSLQAIGTVAHSVSHDIWSMESERGVHQALRDQRGCWSEPQEHEETDKVMKKSGTNTFASALLDALDDDLKVPAPAPTSGKHPPHSGGFLAPNPGSTGFLSSFVGGGDSKMKQMQLNMRFCVLNGIHAAAGACRSLVNFLDSLLDPTDTETFDALPASDNEKATSMIELAREELSRYSSDYETLLKTQVDDVLNTWCGAGDLSEATSTIRGRRDLPLNALRVTLENEDYHLDANSFTNAESDERLDAVLIAPLRDSIFFKVFRIAAIVMYYT